MRTWLSVAGAVALPVCLASFASPIAEIKLSSFCTAPGSDDSTQCINQWLQAGTASNTLLRGSHGTYRYRGGQLILNSNLRINCGHNHATTFQRKPGEPATFLAATTDAVQNVHIVGCDFDVNGSLESFLSVIDINPDNAATSHDIEVSANRFYDSKITGHMSAAQRQYVLLLRCQSCSVNNNTLSEGGRIKVGQPGSDLQITGNTLNNVNDDAISVVDVTDPNGGELSQHIVITGNTITSPLGIGIFFGADGETQTGPLLATKDVDIENNHITGDWDTACILGILPATASQIKIANNTCTKTGTAGRYAAGIGIKRTDSATNSTTGITIDNNKIQGQTNWVSWSYAALNNGGIFISGAHDAMTITNNHIIKVGAIAMVFQDGSTITNATVTNNTIDYGKIQGLALVNGTTGPNTITHPVPTSP